MAACDMETAETIAIREIICDDSDESEAVVLLLETHRKRVRTILEDCEDKTEDPEAHVQNFVEEVVPRYSDHQFKTHFRMYPDVFEALCQWVAPHLPQPRSLTVEKKLLATVWLIGNKESYRSVADRFGFNRGVLHRIVMNVCKILTSLRGDVIKWPRRNELRHLAEQWGIRAGFPGVVGAIDGSYIKILGPTEEDRDAYICRKGFPAIQLQIVCSQDLLFLDVNTGNVGSVHDSRVFRTSDLCLMLESAEGRLPQEYHILGDSAYPLKDYLMVPFRDNGHLSRLERSFNVAHSQTRVDVERAIGLLKGKFRRLKDLEMTKISDIPYVIFAACVLHNFIIRENGIDAEDIDHCDSEEEEEEGEEIILRSATDKRMHIAHLLG